MNYNNIFFNKEINEEIDKKINILINDIIKLLQLYQFYPVYKNKYIYNDENNDKFMAISILLQNKQLRIEINKNNKTDVINIPFHQLVYPYVILHDLIQNFQDHLTK
ncbi:hypothetical protein DEFDS_P116 (plasmid) [Deferribacter desulfuricans SSM1]|uniref:Uncharacterized protein n=1 Tax=Deferribacter desulfuricans (strain DSM 14783 / JCM 11476 / NBRC 101012 / SSM1) TaxID=639282 RepID=D3PEU6_DEFDS|nr:hypothetical protein [Deferribacter desulfuricans]BAI81738.1 hypothetical protein DEFDS_P116 [Deferribacter desulfuricans SSM1]